jgi:uncharacterized membrane protein (DUF2068 family)
MEQSATVIRLIGVFKMVKTLILLGAAVLLLRARSGDATHEAIRFVEHLGIDPGSHFVRAAIARVNGMSAHKLELFAIGCVLYAAVFATEGTGLLLRKHWAEWFTVVVTASFMPFEVYELAHHATVARVAALAINALVVVYLLVRIHMRKRSPDDAPRIMAREACSPRARSSMMSPR